MLTIIQKAKKPQNNSSDDEVEEIPMINGKNEVLESKKKESSNKSCFVCEKSLISLNEIEVERHLNICLDRKSALELAKKLEEEEEDASKEKCTDCGVDLSLYSEKRKEQHLEKCKKKKEKVEEKTCPCVICFKDISSLAQRSKISHVKLCAKVQKLTTKEIKEIITNLKNENSKKSQKKKEIKPKNDEKENLLEGIDLDDSLFEEYKYDPKLKGQKEIPITDLTVQSWLDQNGLSQYVENFFNNGFDTLEVCSEIKKEDIDKELEIKLSGHVKKLTLAVKQLKKEYFITKRKF